MTIPFSSIIEGDRMRARTNYGDLAPLIDSLERIGTIQPISLSKRKPATPAEEKLVCPEGYVYDLCAGGRRYRSMLKLKVKELHHASILNPERLGFLWKDEVPEHTLREAELDENLQRKDMEWADIVLGIERIHAAKKAKSIKWTQAQTAKLLPKTWGKTAISNFLIVAKHIKAGDKEILGCENMTEAIKVLMKRNEDKALAELQRRAAGATKAKISTASFLDEISIDTASPTKEAKPAVKSTKVEVTKEVAELTSTPSKPTSAPAVEQPGEPVVIHLSKRFTVGDFRTILPQLPDASIHHVLTDIPYGIDMSNLDLQGLESVVEQHDVDQNVDQMPAFLREAHRIVKPGGFCVFFYDLDHHEKLLGWAEAAGWRPQRWPFIATKSSACRNQNAAKNTTKNYEVAMILRHDETSVLREPYLNTSHRTYDFRIERSIYNNPFAKPFALWRDLIQAIAFPGQSLLDPFCGEMSSICAMVNCGMQPFGCEISETHFNRGLMHVKAKYMQLYKDNVKFE